MTKPLPIIPAGTTASGLAQMDTMLKAISGQLHTFESFVLKHGRQWTSAPLPSEYPRGIMGECFRNAALLSLRYPELTYVEGYATRIIPLLHAWCVTPDGLVVDSTWNDPEEADYFGVPFLQTYLSKELVRTKVYGLIDRMEGGPKGGFRLVRDQVPVAKFLRLWPWGASVQGLTPHWMEKHRGEARERGASPRRRASARTKPA